MSEPNVKIIANRQFMLNVRDFLHGGIMAIVSAVLTYVTASLTDGGSFESIKWKQIALISAITTGTYLLKKLGEPSDTTIKVKNDDPNALAKQMKSAGTISIEKTPGQSPSVTTSVG